MVNRYQPPPYNPGPRIPLNTDDEKRDFAGLMMPKTVVSLAIWIFMFGLGVAVAGLLLFIVYQGQVNALEGRIIDSQEELEKRLTEKFEKGQVDSVPQATASLNVSGTSAERLKSELVKNVSFSMLGIQGTSREGTPTTGTGFVVNSTDGGSWAITNFSLVSGSTPEANSVSVRLANSDLIGQVYETDPGADLALVTFNVPASRSLRFTSGELKEGDTVYAFGYSRNTPYAVALEAKLVDYGPNRITIDVDPGAQFNGGPVIDAAGRVVGIMSSKAPKPSGKASGKASASPVAGSRSVTPIQQVCNVVLRCPGGAKAQASPSASGSPRSRPKSTPSLEAVPLPPAPAPPTNAAPDIPLPPQ